MIMKWQPQCHFMQESAVLSPSVWKWSIMLPTYAAEHVSSWSICTCYCICIFICHVL